MIIFFDMKQINIKQIYKLTLKEKLEELSVKNISLSSVCNWGFGQIFPWLCKTHGPGACKFCCLCHFLYGTWMLHFISLENEATIAISASTFQHHFLKLKRGFIFYGICSLAINSKVFCNDYNKNCYFLSFIKLILTLKSSNMIQV